MQVAFAVFIRVFYRKELPAAASNKVHEWQWTKTVKHWAVKINRDLKDWQTVKGMGGDGADQRMHTSFQFPHKHAKSVIKQQHQSCIFRLSYRHSTGHREKKHTHILFFAAHMDRFVNQCLINCNVFFWYTCRTTTSSLSVYQCRACEVLSFMKSCHTWCLPIYNSTVCILTTQTV